MSFDYAGRADSRIIAQYRNDNKLKSFIAALANMVNTKFEQAADKRRLLYSIDDNSGVNLDLIGRVLGQPRPRISNITGFFFGYDGTPGATGYNQAPYFDYAAAGDTYIALPDEAYKRLLKSKAAKNVTDCSFDSILEVAELLTGDSGVTLTNNQDMTFDLIFTITPDSYTQILLNNFDVIPEPAGVAFTGWSVV